MRSSMLLAAVLLCGCADDDNDVVFVPSPWMGAYVGTCEESIDGVADPPAQGVIDGVIGERGNYSGSYSLAAGDHAGLFGMVANDGQFIGDGYEGVISGTADGIVGELSQVIGRPPVTYRLTFSMVRQ